MSHFAEKHSSQTFSVRSPQESFALETRSKPRLSRVQCVQISRNSKFGPSEIENVSRSGSRNKAGIKVMSRNSSQEAKESPATSYLQKLSRRKQLLDNKTKQRSFFGLNCMGNGQSSNQQPFKNQITVPTFESAATFQSEYVPEDKLSRYYQRDQQPQREQSNIEKWKQEVKALVAEKQKQLEKQYRDNCQSLQLFYQGQLRAIKSILGQNQTLVEILQQKITTLEAKSRQYETHCQDMLDRVKQLGEGLDSKLFEYRGQMSKLKQTIQQIQSGTSNSARQSSSLIVNRFEYLKDLFGDIMKQTLVKCRSIQNEVRQELNSLTQKYDYFQEKIYEVDLCKNLGKQNGIKIMQLSDQLDHFKEELALFKSMAKRSYLTSNVDINQKSHYLRGQAPIEQLQGHIQLLKQEISRIQLKSSRDRHNRQCSSEVLQMYKEKLKQIESELQTEREQKAQLQQCLELSEGLFDQQVAKFKETIVQLQQENELLLQQLEEEKQATSGSNKNQMENSSYY